MSWALPSPARSSSRFLVRSSCRRILLRSPDPPILPRGARERKPQHREENRNQPRRGLQRAALPLREDRKSSINKFDVHPVHQQRSIPELDDRAETQLRKSPPAPRVNQKENNQQDAAAHQQKIWTAVPVVVSRVQPHAR